MTLAQQRLEKAKANLKTEPNVGNKGGGRTPNYLRAEHQAAHSDLMAILIRCVKEEKEVPNWVIKSLDTTGKYGLGELKDVSLNKDDMLVKVARALGEYAERYERPASEVQHLYELIVKHCEDC